MRPKNSSTEHAKHAKHPNNLTMPAAKIHARPPGIKQTEDEFSDASVQSEHTTESSEDEDEDEDEPEPEPDSDSLDSQSSRKRRKLSLVPNDDDDDDDEPQIPIPVPQRINTLQRVKSVGKSNAINSNAVQGAILAPIDPETTFTSLNVKPWLAASLKNMAIRRPTGIQKGCIPEILKGRDCIGGSRTGSGKTVAFAVPILQKWAEDPFGIFALVLTPTRYAIGHSWCVIISNAIIGNLLCKSTSNSKPFLPRNRSRLS